MSYGYQTNTWGGVVGHPAGVTSIKDLFYLTYGSDEKALRDIAAAGYDGFEIFDGNLARYVDDPTPLEGWMRETGLTLIAVYSGANFIYADCLDDEFLRLEQATGLGQRFGASYHVIGGGAIRGSGPGASDYEALARGLDRVAALTSRFGLQAMFHPHLGTIVQAPDELDRLLRLTDIPLCPDTGHVIAGGGDPVELIRSYHDRIPYVHFKDWADGRFLPLGEGTMDLPAVVAALGGAPDGMWWTVELDETDKDPRVAAEESLRALKDLVR
jgi:inosose dehydratase